MFPTIEDLALVIQALERRVQALESPPPPPDRWTRRQAADFHGVSTRTIQEWEKSYGLTPCAQGPITLYAPETVRAFRPPSLRANTNPCRRCGTLIPRGIMHCDRECPPL